MKLINRLFKSKKENKLGKLKKKLTNLANKDGLVLNIDGNIDYYAYELRLCDLDFYSGTMVDISKFQNMSDREIHRLYEKLKERLYKIMPL